jgi:hypothetical protein
MRRAGVSQVVLQKFRVSDGSIGHSRHFRRRRMSAFRAIATAKQTSRRSAKCQGAGAAQADPHSNVDLLVQ